MTPASLWLGLIILAPFEPTPNPVLQNLLDQGVVANGVQVPLPPPSLPDGQSAEASRAVLKSLAGDDRSVENLVRDSITAPFILKTRDVKAGDSTIRLADLWFVVRGQLDEIDLQQFLGKTEATTVEAGNMRMSSQLLTKNDLQGRQLDPLPDLAGRTEWYTRATGRLLDRINVEVTDHAVATRTGDSLTIAAATSRAFDSDPTYPNRWSTVTPAAGSESAKPPQTYAGSGSYVKITTLAAQPGCLLIEAHFAFEEPDPWFSGNPILRSKFSLICQDQVRHLRREIQKRRAAK